MEPASVAAGSANCLSGLEALVARAGRDSVPRQWTFCQGSGDCLQKLEGDQERCRPGNTSRARSFCSVSFCYARSAI